ncbi:hypothetical protein [Parafrankia elaeagni]|uniref:hypothetical protein n=1 Tax=Parafrankia elaeagni TaxID=222534 RepID=UPI00037CF84F|nr:hypothetical protein [Parafrankia elaeagni]
MTVTSAVGRGEIDHGPPEKCGFRTDQHHRRCRHRLDIGTLGRLAAPGRQAIGRLMTILVYAAGELVVRNAVDTG